MPLNAVTGEPAIAPPFTPRSLPRVISPMLPAMANEPFDSHAHIFEVLWDGLRCMTFVEGGHIRLQNRWGVDITGVFPELREIAVQMKGTGVVIDGVIVMPDGDGRPDSGSLAMRLDAAPDKSPSPLAVLQAFDLVYREGQPLTGWPLRRRKEMLRALVRGTGPLAVPDWVARDGTAFFEAARGHGLWGIVAKETESTYREGEAHPSWLTIPVYRKGKFVVGGYTFGGCRPSRPGRRPPDPEIRLLVGRLTTSGHVKLRAEVPIGLASDERSALLSRLEEMSVPECPFDPPPPATTLVSWCRPDLVASIRYAGGEAGGGLRFPVFDGLRPDVPATMCRADTADVG